MLNFNIVIKNFFLVISVIERIKFKFKYQIIFRMKKLFVKKICQL
jgi:hypothetical protein